MLDELCLVEYEMLKFSPYFIVVAAIYMEYEMLNFSLSFKADASIYEAQNVLYGV